MVTLSNVQAMVEVEGGMGAALRLYVLHKMLDHRGVTITDLAAVSGRTYTYMVKILSGYDFLNTKNVQSYYRKLDAVDHAVDTFCGIRGWVCKCSPDAHAIIQQHLGGTP